MADPLGELKRSPIPPSREKGREGEFGPDGMGMGDDRKEGTRKEQGKGKEGRKGGEKKRKGEGKGARELSGEVFVTTPSLVFCATHAELFRLLTP